MASTSGVSSTSSTSSSSSSSGGLDSLDGNAFLTLLTAQLQNQDPESAQDPNEFVNQLVSFSQLEQLIDIHQTLTNAFGSNSTTGTNGTNSTNNGASSS
jgi:flagellar basal-body rod modification protein FlgD